MGFFGRERGLKPTRKKTVSADIAVYGDHLFFCELESHDLQLQASEIIRLALHYFAEILFNFGAIEPIASEGPNDLNSLMRRALTSPIESGCDVLAAAGISDSVRILPGMPVLRSDWAQATLYKTGGAWQLAAVFSKDMSGEIAGFSVFVLLQTIINELGDDQDSLWMMAMCLATLCGKPMDTNRAAFER